MSAPVVARDLVRLRIVNLTPHAVVLLNDDNTARLTIPPSGAVARLQQAHVPTRREWCFYDEYGTEVPITGVTLTEIVGLPEPTAGSSFLVSLAVALGARSRGRTTADLLIMRDQVRDDTGRIIGCRSLGVLL